MKDFATKYLNWYNGLSKIVKVLLCILWDIPTCLARFCRSALKDDVLGMVLAVIICLFGGWILFVIDLVLLLINDKVYWLDDLGVENITASLTESGDEKKEEAKVEATEEAHEEVAEEAAEEAHNDASDDAE